MRRKPFRPALIGIALIAVFLVGCDTNRDDAHPTITGCVIGTWQANRIERLVGGAWQPDHNPLDSEYDNTVVFRSDGTYVEPDDGGQSHGTYAVDGATLSVTSEDGNTDKAAFECSDDALVVTPTGYYFLWWPSQAPNAARMIFARTGSA